jgi:hypothetical protein
MAATTTNLIALIIFSLRDVFRPLVYEYKYMRKIFASQQ